MRLEQIVEPGSPSSFFESDRQSSAQSGKEFQNGCGFRFQDRFHDYLALGIHHRYRDRCLMNIETNILFAVHEGAPFVGHDGNDHNLLPKGPLIMRLQHLLLTAVDFPTVQKILKDVSGTKAKRPRSYPR